MGQIGQMANHLDWQQHLQIVPVPLLLVVDTMLELHMIIMICLRALVLPRDVLL